MGPFSEDNEHPHRGPNAGLGEEKKKACARTVNKWTGSASRGSRLPAARHYYGVWRPVLRSHLSLIRAAMDPPSSAPASSSSGASAAGATCSTAARMADSPPKASAFPFIVLSMLMKPLFRLKAVQTGRARVECNGGKRAMSAT